MGVPDFGRVLYLCDGRACDVPDHCAMNGTGKCRHTTKWEHALHRDADLKDFQAMPSPMTGKVDLWEPCDG